MTPALGACGALVFLVREREIENGKKSKKVAKKKEHRARLNKVNTELTLTGSWFPQVTQNVYQR